MQAKVIIVDDNPVTVRSLTQTIDWEGMGCVVVGTAMDGESGKELILREEPDILLLDIRMPQKDGLQMLEEVRQAVPECKVIIITGYDQFQYASRAIRLSVFDYILKPIRNSVVEEVVRRALADMSSKRAQAVAVRRATRLTAQTQLLSLLMNDSRSGQDVHQMMREAGIYSPSYMIALVNSASCDPLPHAAFADVEEKLAEQGVRAVTLFLYDALVLYVMFDEAQPDAKGAARRIASTIRSMVSQPVTLGMSAPTSSHHRIRQAYKQARQALWERALGRSGEEGSFFDPEEAAPGGMLAQLQQRVEQLCERCSLEEADLLDAAAQLYALSGRQYSSLRAIVSFFVMLLCKKYPCGASQDVDREISAALFVSCEEDVRQSLCRLAQAIREARGEKGESQCSLMTRSVLEYIRLHAAESLRLSDIADRFHINTNYLSLLIKRETGVTFHEHVLRAKMDIAHTMLADPRIRVAEVARAVGYSNYVSFYNTFKRLEHMTPTEYRNQVVPASMLEEEEEEPV